MEEHVLVCICTALHHIQSTKRGDWKACINEHNELWQAKGGELDQYMSLIS